MLPFVQQFLIRGDLIKKMLYSVQDSVIEPLLVLKLQQVKSS